jgi:hypothetical protein
MEIRIATRIGSGTGNIGAAKAATYSGMTMYSMLLPIASPSRATERAKTVRFTSRLAAIFESMIRNRP